MSVTHALRKHFVISQGLRCSHRKCQPKRSVLPLRLLSVQPQSHTLWSGTQLSDFTSTNLLQYHPNADVSNLAGNCTCCTAVVLAAAARHGLPAVCCMCWVSAWHSALPTICARCTCGTCIIWAPSSSPEMPYPTWGFTSPW